MADVGAWQVAFDDDDATGQLRRSHAGTHFIRLRNVRPLTAAGAASAR